LPSPASCLFSRSADHRPPPSFPTRRSSDLDPAWRLMDSGELIHLGADGTLRSEHPFGPLAHALSLEELGLSAAASQVHAAQAREQEHRRRRLAEVGA